MEESKEEIKKMIDKIESDQLKVVQSTLKGLLPKQHDIKFHLNPDLDNIPLEEDMTGRGEIVSSIAKIIAEAECPHTFCINGSWGSGKTVFLRWIKNEIDANYSKSTFTHWFEPWKYESMSNLMFPLVKEIEEYAPGRKIDAQTNKFLKKIIEWTIKFWLLFKFSISISLSSKIWKAFQKDDLNPNQSFKYIASLKKEFSQYVNYILDINSENAIQKEKFIILIDDLDRCLPENVITLLESIKNFFSTNNCIFVLAIDKEILSDSIKSKYGGVLSFNGEEYLEKIIKFTFDLPVNIDLYSINFIKSYQDSYPDLFLDSKIQQLAPLLFIESKSTSIRMLKKVLNRYQLVISYTKINNINVDRDIMFLTIFLSYIYRDFFDLTLKFRNNNFIDRTNAIRGDQLIVDENKFDVWQRYMMRQLRKSNINDILNGFKRVKFASEQNYQNHTISTEYYDCCDILRKLM